MKNSKNNTQQCFLFNMIKDQNYIINRLKNACESTKLFTRSRWNDIHMFRTCTTCQKKSIREADKNQDKEILRHFQDTLVPSLRSVQSKLGQKEINISLNTISSRLHENDVSSWVTLQKSLLSHSKTTELSN